VPAFSRLAIALAVAFGTVGGVAQADDGLATFTWTMPSRFGHEGPDRLLDYPQSAADVDSGPFEVDFALNEGACSPGLTRTWTVEGRKVLPEPSGRQCRFSLNFDREGQYDVRLQVEGEGHDDSSTQRVVVQDFLIVAIGDSVASGEGNPDRRSRIPGRTKWENKPCHRSSRAGTVKAAAAIEAHDEKTSVTFVHLACSGATMQDGLIGPFKARPQLEQLREIEAKRDIDAVVLSIGANDIRFSKIVALCVWKSDCFDQKVNPRKWGLSGGPKLTVSQTVDSLIGQLPDRYARVAAQLPAVLRRHPDRVYITEYFDPTHRTPDDFCPEILLGDKLPLNRFRIAGPEVKLAYDQVLVPLNKRVRDAADQHRWTYVAGVADAFASHGACTGSQRWIRQLDESLTQQALSRKGALHPNEDGHARTGELIAAALRANLFPENEPASPPTPAATEKIALASGVVPPTLAAGNAPTGPSGDDDDEVTWGLVGLAIGVAAATILALVLRGDRWTWLGQLARIAAAGLLGVVAWRLAFETDPDAARAGVAAGLLLLAVLLLVLRPSDIRRFVGRIQSVNAAGFGVSLGEAEKAAARAQPEELSDDKIPKGASTSLAELRLKLEAKLAYIVKEMLHDYATLGSLKVDGYLSREDAEVAGKVLALADEDVRYWDPAELGQFRRSAEKVVGGIRASVFRGMVKKVLEGAGWEVREDKFGASLGGRPDLEVFTGTNEGLRVVPVFANERDSKIFRTARRRLSQVKEPEDPSRRLLVVPDFDTSPTETDDPRAVKLADLTAALGPPPPVD
jgi:lysophospholipase L1-like esterase